MISENIFEEILSKYPILIEDSLSLKGRQLTLHGRRIDLLFEDKFKRKLIVELKIGPIKDDHIGQILSYEGMLLSADDPTIRVMLIGNRVPPNIQKALDHHGIAWKEISFTTLKAFLNEKKDSEFLPLFDDIKAELQRVSAPTVKAAICRAPFDRPRGSYYEKACKLKHNKNTDTSQINELLKQGKIQEGRIDFTKLPGFTHYLGNCGRSILEFDGNFALYDIVYKEGNKKLIKEATLKKVLNNGGV